MRMMTNRLRLKSLMVGLSALAVMLVGWSAPSFGAQKSVTITMWNIGDAQPVVTQLITGFEKANPSIHVQVVNQPYAEYFATLQTSLLSKSAPDLAMLWPAEYLQRYESYFTDLGKSISRSVLGSIPGESYFSKSGSVAAGAYVVPIDIQTYQGYYNASLLKKAGISSPPSDWTQIFQDCTLLKAKGITPMEYGSFDGAAEFEFYNDWSYLLAGALPVSKWNDLLDGKLSYTSPAILHAVTMWAKMHSSGCTNSTILNVKNAPTVFNSGKAAMVVNSDFFQSLMLPHLGKSLGNWIPGFSDSPAKTVVLETGFGYGIPSSASHATQATKFLKYVLSAAGEHIIAAAGQIPPLPSYKPTGALNAQIDQWVTSGKYAVAPMFDNFMQPGVQTVAAQLLPEVMAGQVTPASALSQMEAAFKALPAAQRNVSYHIRAGG